MTNPPLCHRAQYIECAKSSIHNAKPNFRTSNTHARTVTVRCDFTSGSHRLRALALRCFTTGSPSVYWAQASRGQRSADRARGIRVIGDAGDHRHGHLLKLRRRRRARERVRTGPQRLVNVIAIGVDTKTSHTVATNSWKCVAAIAQFYGFGDVPIGSDMPDNGTTVNFRTCRPVRGTRVADDAARRRPR